MADAEALLTITIHSYWHAGTGKGSSHYLDALPVTDQEGLPFLPGRTLKGVLRDAMTLTEEWKHLPPGTVFTLFGGWEKAEKKVNTRHNSHPGLLRVGDGVLPDGVRRWLALDENAHYRQGLFQPLFSTAVEHETGSARNKSLRGIQVVVPMALTAIITCLDAPPTWRQNLVNSLPLIRAIGSHRTRGLGRATLTLGDVHP